MKKLLLLSLLFMLSTAAMAQNTYNKEFFYKKGRVVKSVATPFVDGEVVYSKVFEMEGVSSKDIYDRARLTMVDFFKSSKDVTQLDNPENKTIVVKGWTSWLKDSVYVLTVGFDVHYTMKIECREDRFKVTIYGFSSSTYNSTLGKLEFSQSTCLKRGIKKNQFLTTNIYGYSWVAWNEVSERNFDKINSKMQDITINDENATDW